MDSPVIVPFLHLHQADLRVDAIYQGRRNGNAGDDPLHHLLGVSLMGGFRYLGSKDALKMLVLTTSLSDPDWPDALDAETGVFTYYGDNKRPGRELHGTPRFGNEILRHVFELARGGPEQRSRVPPIFVFASAGTQRDVKYLGLAVPATLDLRSTEDLVAIWKSVGGARFQNYRARFTILDAPSARRAWINDVAAGNPHSPNAPDAWSHWVASARLTPLSAERAIEHREKTEQLPQGAEENAIVRLLHDHFASRPHDFEYCAAAITKMMLPETARLDVTRRSRDGGRDGLGQLRVGVGPSAILIDFAMEAKCYQVNQSVGVREVSRLISRLRHRQFGVLVTTSYLDSQAYKEIKEDKHPIVVIAARDIVAILRANGRGNPESVRAWLDQEFAAAP